MKMRIKLGALCSLAVVSVSLYFFITPSEQASAAIEPSLLPLDQPVPSNLEEEIQNILSNTSESAAGQSTETVFVAPEHQALSDQLEVLTQSAEVSTESSEVLEQANQAIEQFVAENGAISSIEGSANEELEALQTRLENLKNASN